VGFVEVARSYVSVKIALLFFLLITHGCGALASLAARHTNVCLDYTEMLVKDELFLVLLFYFVILGMKMVFVV